MLYSSTDASSMSVAIANPITFYYGSPHTVISQVGQSGDLYNYYWTSYSRGTDGKWDKGANWHNLYLDSYIPLRYKSIYDPCPYGYRIPSNGTYNQFTNAGWKAFSYAGGTLYNNNWFASLGLYTTTFGEYGIRSSFWFSTPFNNTNAYDIQINSSKGYIRNDNWGKPYGLPVRCIEECEILLDATEAKATYL